MNTIQHTVPNKQTNYDYVKRIENKSRNSNVVTSDLLPPESYEKKFQEKNTLNDLTKKKKKKKIQRQFNFEFDLSVLYLFVNICNTGKHNIIHNIDTRIKSWNLRIK